ncbi:MAG: hypothetical protein NTV68_11040 [Methanomicrobiales archaeon]|nr:hypothetical protein [Methanomicrobiales archaeon]
MQWSLQGYLTFAIVFLVIVLHRLLLLASYTGHALGKRDGPVNTALCKQNSRNLGVLAGPDVTGPCRAF